MPFYQQCGGERTVADTLAEYCLCLPAQLILLANYRESGIYITTLAGNRIRSPAPASQPKKGAAMALKALAFVQRFNSQGKSLHKPDHRMPARLD